jgi:hypothetical protein
VGTDCHRQDDSGVGVVSVTADRCHPEQTNCCHPERSEGSMYFLRGVGASDFAVLDELATISGGDSFLNFTDKPRVVVHHALHCFYHQRLGVAAHAGTQVARAWPADRGSTVLPWNIG